MQQMQHSSRLVQPSCPGCKVAACAQSVCTKLVFTKSGFPGCRCHARRLHRDGIDSLSSFAHGSLCLQMSWHEDEEDLEGLIGPAPPELAGELETVSGDERSAEVVRVLR